MSKIEKAAVLIAIFMAVSAASCYGQSYMGIEIGHKNNGLKKGHGGEVFAKHSPFLDVHVGKTFSDNWGIEVGASTTTDKKRESHLIGAKAALPGCGLTPGYDHITKSETQTRSFYAGIVGLYPVNERLKFFGMIGLGHTWVRNEYKPTTLNNRVLTLSRQAAATRTFKTHGNNIILKIGIKHNITEDFGVKTTFSWENTSKFTTKSSQSPNLPDRIKHRDTIRTSIGFYFNAV